MISYETVLGNSPLPQHSFSGKQHRSIYYSQSMEIPEGSAALPELPCRVMCSSPARSLRTSRCCLGLGVTTGRVFLLPIYGEQMINPLRAVRAELSFLCHKTRSSDLHICKFSIQYLIFFFLQNKWLISCY